MNKRASCVETPLGTLLCTSMLGSCKLIDVQSFNLIANAAASRWVSRCCDRLEYSACGIHAREAAHFSVSFAAWTHQVIDHRQRLLIARGKCVLLHSKVCFCS